MPSFSILVAAALKSTVILCAAWCVSLLLRKRSAAARHLLWTGAAAAALILPFLSVSLPSWPVTAPHALAALDPSVMFSVTATARPLAEGTSMARAATLASLPGAPAPWRPSLQLMVLLAWAAGVAVGIAQMLAAVVAMWRIRRNACPFKDQALSRELARSLGIRHEVPVLQIEAGSMPIVHGLWRPAVYLPADADNWSGEKLRMVLLHEFAHVRRGDLATHLIARTALSLYWWNPLAWSAWRQFLKERERAADDLVLASGARASDYAGHLLDVARSMNPAPAAAWAAIAMARPSQLEGRLLAILDGGRNRKAAGPAAVAAAVLAAVLIAAPVAAVRAQERKAAEPVQTAPAPPASPMVTLRTAVQVASQTAAAQPARREAPQPMSPEVEAAIRSATVQRNYDMLDTAATLFEKKQNYIAATQLLEAALAIRGQVSGERSPEYVAGLMKLGDIAQKRHSEVDAQDYYTKAVALGDNPTTAPALVYLGTVAMHGKDVLARLSQMLGIGDNVRSLFERARNADPGGPAARTATMWMALLAQRSNDTSNAEMLYQQALQMGDPNTPEAALIMELYNNLLRESGRTGEADMVAARAATIRQTHVREIGALAQGNLALQATSVQPYRVGNGVTAPKLLLKREPEYSEEARAAKYQGTVTLKVTIGADGMAHNIELLHSLGMGLDEKAVAALQAWRFQPGTKDGQPVPVIATIEINFRLL